MHAATLAILTKTATIFWEHEVCVDCCHSNTEIYIFSVFFFKNCENNGKISVLILVLLTIFLFCHLYVTILSVSLNLV